MSLSVDWLDRSGMDTLPCWACGDGRLLGKGRELPLESTLAAVEPEVFADVFSVSCGWMAAFPSCSKLGYSASGGTVPLHALSTVDRLATLLEGIEGAVVEGATGKEETDGSGTDGDSGIDGDSERPSELCGPRESELVCLAFSVAEVACFLSDFCLMGMRATLGAGAVSVPALLATSLWFIATGKSCVP